jgi:hypothetical protein
MGHAGWATIREITFTLLKLYIEFYYYGGLFISPISSQEPLHQKNSKYESFPTYIDM